MYKLKERELRGGIFYMGCECVRRNGMQYDCQRTECQGRPQCTKLPFPTCSPARYGARFANIAMGKRTNPIGVRTIRVFEDGSVIQYDPCFPPDVIRNA